MIFIIDIDNTIADFSHRAHLVDNEAPDWAKFLSPDLVALDKPIENAQKAMKWLLSHTPIVPIFLTGRNESLRDVSTKWIKDHFGLDVNEKTLLMRPTDSSEVPSEYKFRQLSKLVYQYNPPWIAIDDDPYTWPVYRHFGALVIKAPEGWDTLFPHRDDLGPETNWRK